MSFTKETFKNCILDPISKIQEKTLEDNDLSELLKYLNVAIDIQNKITTENEEIGKLWNEIVTDLISAINASISGSYRLSLISLRSVLETGCHSFFFYDHKIEYHLFQNEDKEADKYINTLINDFDFFTTKYIRAFKNDIDIDKIQEEDDSISKYLKKIYKKLCDITHGRYKTLTKIDNEQIDYNKEFYKRFEKKYFEVVSILTTLYFLRFNKKNNTIVEVVKHSKTLNL